MAAEARERNGRRNGHSAGLSAPIRRYFSGWPLNCENFDRDGCSIGAGGYANTGSSSYKAVQ
jgi:hypothetical protein